jgi:hypothetical protein
MFFWTGGGGSAIGRCPFGFSVNFEKGTTSRENRATLPNET